MCSRNTSYKISYKFVKTTTCRQCAARRQAYSYLCILPRKGSPKADPEPWAKPLAKPKVKAKFRNNKKRSVASQRAHNNMLAHVARAWCSDASLHVATLVCLTALPMSLQLARPNPPSTFPTHVVWCMYASMSGSPVATHTNDAPRHPTARTKHQPSPPARLQLARLPILPPPFPPMLFGACTPA